MLWIKACFVGFLGYSIGIFAIFFSLLVALLLCLIAALGEWRACENDDVSKVCM